MTLDGPPLGLSKQCKYVYLSSDVWHAACWFIDGWFALMVGSGVNSKQGQSLPSFHVFGWFALMVGLL